MLKRCFDTCGRCFHMCRNDGQKTIEIRFYLFVRGLLAFYKNMLTRFTNFCIVASDTYFATRTHFGTNEGRSSLFVETVTTCTTCLLTVGTGAVTIGTLFSEFGHFLTNALANVWEEENVLFFLNSSLVLMCVFYQSFGR